ncbi:MAG: SAM-dependent methyltransferase [Gammaproteobacteria bacterium]
MTTINDLPAPSAAQLARSKALSDLLQQRIKEQGPISFADFMEAALYHPELGYYNAPEFNLGKSGDFTTAPEISPLFAGCLARQCEQILKHLQTGDILELGAGTGRLACQLLLALEVLDCSPPHYYIYEVSVKLREKQKAFLQTNCPQFFERFIWLDELPQDFTGIIIANEVLDALPVHCFEVTEAGILERYVDVVDDQFYFKLAPPTSSELLSRVANLDLPLGYASEMNLNALNYTEQLSNGLSQGVILFLDYGYGQPEYYHPERRKGTLTCFYQHHHHDHPFYYPGLQDITAHVDFTNIIDKAADAGCTLEGFTSQAAFLLGCGLMELANKAEQGLSAVELFQMHQAIKLLTMPTEMGDVIKVMGLGKNIELPLIGFSLQDRRRDL